MNEAQRTRAFRLRSLFLLLTMAVTGLLAVVAAAPRGQAAALREPQAPGLEASLLITPTLTDHFLPLVTNVLDEPGVYGVEMSSISPPNLVALVADMGVQWIRKNALFWSSVEPVNGGGYQWSNVASLDQELINARNAGFQPILIIRSTPDWAQQIPGVACGPMQPQYYDEFGDFLAAAVERYSGPPYYIRHYEIWNEPDVDPALVDPEEIFGCWGDKDDPYYGGRTYGQMLKIVYPRMHAANPDIEVLIGGLLMDCDPRNPPDGKDCTPSLFLEGILTAGAKNAFDGVSFHAYDYYNWIDDTFGNPNWHSGKLFNEPNGVMRPVLIAKADFINEVLAAFSAGEKTLYNTEVALLCGANADPPGLPGCEAEDSSPFEIMKAAYVAQAYAAALGEGLDGNFWFTVRGWRNSGLIYPDGDPRPAYHAYEFSSSLLSHGRFIGKVLGTPHVTGYKFARLEGNDVWVMWATDGTTRVATLPATPLAIWDYMGASVPVTGTSVTLSIAPSYIEMP